MTRDGADGDALELVLSKLDGVRRVTATGCPGVPPTMTAQASLSIKRGTDGPILLHCLAECERDAILDAIGLTLADIASPVGKPAADDWTPFGQAVAIYVYTDADGKMLFRVCGPLTSSSPSGGPSRREVGTAGVEDKGVRRVPVPAAPGRRRGQRRPARLRRRGRTDVRAVEAAGGAATCNPMGAGKWLDDYGECVRRSEVVIVADKDTSRARARPRCRRAARTTARRRSPS